MALQHKCVCVTYARNVYFSVAKSLQFLTWDQKRATRDKLTGVTRQSTICVASVIFQNYIYCDWFLLVIVV